ncbi:hypothetical protein [Paenibacillus azoreducens]|uniref:Lipoprotein n=1 Tax=Paenibacillus azoreducens TaxID=116718 RepID=A0A919YBI1_9BACL|nr:hypothetical protein [Paenibacillus azoreducens]GIO48167.1 hypothetical protein J34TS1_29320 [Paenibacillus azoreducens]
MLKKMAARTVFISLFILFASGCSESNRTDHIAQNEKRPDLKEQQVSFNTSLNSQKTNVISTDLGSILYGKDDNTLHILFNLNLPRWDKVNITLSNKQSEIGAYLGKGNILLSLGEVKDETTLVPVNHGLRAWAQFPVRFLNDGNQMVIKMIDSESNDVILQETLDF